MKLKHLLPILLFMGLDSYSQKVKFAGTAEKKYDGNRIILYNQATGDRDSAIIKDGKFALSVTFKEPTVYMIYSDYEAKSKGLYSPYGIVVAEPGIIRIDVNIETFPETKVRGSKESKLYEEFIAERDILKMLHKMRNDVDATYGKDFINQRPPDTTNLKYKQLMQDYQQIDEVTQKMRMNRLFELIKTNPGSFTAVYFLWKYAKNMKPEDVEAQYAKLSPKYKHTRHAKSIVKDLELRTTITTGKTAPDFTQPDTSGNPVWLSDFHGQYVLLDFWASWCVPCRAENPNVVKAFNQYRNKGFTVLGVSLDQPGKKGAWLAAIYKDDLTWTHVSDLKYWKNEAANLYGIKSIPSNLLIDKEGKIVAKDLRGDELTKKLSEIFGG